MQRVICPVLLGLSTASWGSQRRQALSLVPVISHSTLWGCLQSNIFWELPPVLERGATVSFPLCLEIVDKLLWRCRCSGWHPLGLRMHGEDGDGQTELCAVCHGRGISWEGGLWRKTQSFHVKSSAPGWVFQAVSWDSRLRWGSV